MRTILYGASMTPPEDPCWLLVAPAEVGLLHRLRPAVRATAHGVLVHLERPPTTPGGQLGLIHAGTLTWFGGLSADDVTTLVALLREDAPGPVVAALRHRVVGAARTDLSVGRASPRT